MRQCYDEVARIYAQYRRPDPRIAQALAGALGELDPVVNVGAGTGNYEPADRRIESRRLRGDKALVSKIGLVHDAGEVPQDRIVEPVPP